MRISLRTMRAACAAAVVLMAQAATAQEEFHVASIDTTSATISDSSAGTWTSGSYCDDCAIPHWYAGAEVLFMRPYGSEDRYTDDSTDIGFKTGYRFWLGREFDDGLGARIRWFDYQGAEGVGDTRLAAEFQTLDIEVTQESCLDTWALQMFGGIRYAEHNNVDGLDHSSFSGTGLTLGIQGTRPLRRFDNLYLVMGARWSGIFGNSRDYSDGVAVNVDRDDLISILEIYMGPQYRQELGSGMLIFGSNVETQNWNNGYGDDTQDDGLLGFTMNAAYLW